MKSDLKEKLRKYGVIELSIYDVTKESEGFLQTQVTNKKNIVISAFDALKCMSVLQTIEDAEYKQYAVFAAPDYSHVADIGITTKFGDKEKVEIVYDVDTKCDAIFAVLSLITDYYDEKTGKVEVNTVISDDASFKEEEPCHPDCVVTVHMDGAEFEFLENLSSPCKILESIESDKCIDINDFLEYMNKYIVAVPTEIGIEHLPGLEREQPKFAMSLINPNTSEIAGFVYRNVNKNTGIYNYGVITKLDNGKYKNPMVSTYAKKFKAMIVSS